MAWGASLQQRSPFLADMSFASDLSPAAVPETPRSVSAGPLDWPTSPPPYFGARAREAPAAEPPMPVRAAVIYRVAFIHGRLERRGEVVLA